MRPEQAKQIIRHKGVLTIDMAVKSLRESPTFLSTTEHLVSYAETKRQEPSARMKCLECMHSRLNGGKASDWLRPNLQLESRFHPKPFAPFSERYLLGALWLHIPSRLEGKWDVVGKKAGGLADAQHSPPGH